MALSLSNISLTPVSGYTAVPVFKAGQWVIDFSATATLTGADSSDSAQVYAALNSVTDWDRKS